MSVETGSSELPRPSSFDGPDRYWRAAEAYLDIELTPEQREICEAIAENQYTLVEGANGFGKTMTLVAASLAFRLIHYPSSTVITSGSFSKLKHTFCADAEDLHQDSGMFGQWKWGPNPHIETPGEPTWQYEIHSPRDPEDLEGIHNTHTLVIIDEADKDNVTEEHIDAVESLESDGNDRVVVLCNPPKDESNAVYKIRDSYKHLRYSSFDSHNVQVELGNRDGEKVSGLATLGKIKRDWKKYNKTEWPGVEAARTAHEGEETLDVRWLRRRAGVMPGEDAMVHRPFRADPVEDAFERFGSLDVSYPDGLGLDVARKGGDSNVLTAYFRTVDGPRLVVLDEWNGQDHNVGESNVRDAIETDWRCRFPIDAIGEGSGLADRIKNFYPNYVRFSNGGKAIQEQTFDRKWGEALSAFGDFIDAGGKYNDTTLREEALIAAREIEFEEKYIDSRNAEVFTATSKSAIEDVLDRSPDYLDSAIMACWAANEDTMQKSKPSPAPF